MKEGHMNDEIITIRCVCGWETTGTESDVVTATREHGRRVHNMTPTHDEVLAMAVGRAPVQETLVRQPDSGGP
jgi:predicted small metal-binding protein